MYFSNNVIIFNLKKLSAFVLSTATLLIQSMHLLKFREFFYELNVFFLTYLQMQV